LLAARGRDHPDVIRVVVVEEALAVLAEHRARDDARRLVLGLGLGAVAVERGVGAAREGDRAPVRRPRGRARAPRQVRERDRLATLHREREDLARLALRRAYEGDGPAIGRPARLGVVLA